MRFDLKSRDIKEKIRERVRRENNSLPPKGQQGYAVVLVYPNTYAVGMGNLGFQKIYAAIHSLENAFCHRAFLPEPGDLEILERRGIPLFSYETGTPLSHYDVVAFSLTFEMDYLHALKILQLAHIPLKAEDRGEKDPFILAGGVCAGFNPEPLALFVDAFAVGEGEELVPEFFTVYRKDISKGELLERLAQLPGLYIPSGYEVHYKEGGTIASLSLRKGYPPRVKRRWLKDLASTPTATLIHAPEAVFGDMHLVEINRGCGRHCRFCLAGYLYRPPRFYPMETVMREVRKGLEQGKRIGLVGSACCDHPDIVAIARAIVEAKGSFSISSLRLEKVSEDLLELLAACGHQTLTVAPEAATERLRSVINKPLAQETLLDAIRRIFAKGLRNIKFYFLIGLPSEGEADIAAISRLAWEIGEMRDAAPRKGKKLITFSVNPFIPKPFTPFQRLGLESEDSLKKKIKIIRQETRMLKDFKLLHERPRAAFIQAFLSRGDRRTGEYLLKCHEIGGDWRQVFQEKGFDPTFYAMRSIPEGEILPWDILDGGFKKDYLSREFLNFTRGQITPPCPPPPCFRCGDFEGF